MSRSFTRAVQMRFLPGIVMLWTLGRGLALVGWQPAILFRHDVR